MWIYLQSTMVTPKKLFLLPMSMPCVCNIQVLILVFWEKFFVQGRGYCFMLCNLCNVMQIIQGENLMHLNSSRACPLAGVLSDASKVGNLIAYSMK